MNYLNKENVGPHDSIQKNKEKEIKDNLNSDSLVKNLNERLKLFENENKTLRQQLIENEKSNEIELKELKTKLLIEIQNSNQKDLSNNTKINQLEEEKKKNEKKLNEIQNNYDHLKNETKLIFQNNEENLLLKKQLKCLENEKERHISQNSIVI